ncbi:transcription factor e2f/dimerization partner (tdp) domain containing protein [Acanthamoeba castellanii str. Neff]|uniref:Transcription factor e2f/dimerization partner (Tdp) domain containing protein n=1 Tax=Acanthamoeba castellanii (strain ATCC 30010 / Neff) TaxID=1257118 RepID=L8HDJ6_ACACF|nr:transcription factor e2f/dimerization partner (tdp) domain containing protein [Acanthamoeba castellanii str. Neff]ELR22838.1 transcription factor e2f/dimerization partner (tdp) domain containing protein [Acanthamoeba castellanii str. Neff]
MESQTGEWAEPLDAPFDGIEDIAKHSGIVQNGELPVFKAYSSTTASPFQAPSLADDALMTMKRKEPSTPPGPVALATTTSSAEVASSPPAGSRKKRRTQNRGAKNKGLRHFSLKVCEKVQSKRVTTYNEVADELVTELQMLAAAGQAEGMGNNSSSQKNIRRRVYDALNVLMAMDIITKEKKEIRWVGLPTHSKQDLHKLEVRLVSKPIAVSDQEARLERIRKKSDHLEELVSQQRSYANLLARNSKADPGHMADASAKIHLPFILVNTRNTTEIECEMAEDHSEYFFNFSAPFEIHDDTEVLKRAGMDREQPGTPSHTVAPIRLSVTSPHTTATASTLPRPPMPFT